MDIKKIKKTVADASHKAADGITRAVDAIDEEKIEGFKEDTMQMMDKMSQKAKEVSKKASQEVAEAIDDIDDEDDKEAILKTKNGAKKIGQKVVDVSKEAMEGIAKTVDTIDVKETSEKTLDSFKKMTRQATDTFQDVKKNMNDSSAPSSLIDEMIDEYEKNNGKKA